MDPRPTCNQYHVDTDLGVSITYTSLNHINVLPSGRVESLVEVVLILIHKLADNNRALQSSILHNGAGWLGDGVLDDRDTELLIEVGWLDVSESVGSSLEESSSTTWEDTELNGSTGGVERINVTVLLLANLNLGGATDLDDGDTARELGKTLLELLLLVVGGGWVVDDAADLLAALGDGVLASVAVEDDGVLLGDGDGSGGAEHVSGGLLKLDIKLVGEDGGVSEDSDIAEDGLAVVTEAWGLDGSNLELTAELVENAYGKSLAIDILSNDDQRSAELGGSLEGWNDVLNGGDLLLGEEDQWLLELNLLGLGISDEVWGNESTVEAHALRDGELVLHGLALLDGDDTLLSDLLHCIGNQSTDVLVAVGRDSGDLSDLSAGCDITLVNLEVLDNSLDGGLGSSAEIHWVASGSHVLDSLGENSSCEDSRRCGSITSSLVGLRRDILEEAGTEILELVLEGNSSGNSDTI